MTENARHLFTLVILCMACFPLWGQRHGVEYVKITEHNHNPKYPSLIRFSSWRYDPEANEEYYFEKLVNYADSGKAYGLDIRVTEQREDFSLWYTAYDTNNRCIKISHRKYDTLLHRSFLIELDKNPVENRLKSSYTIEGGSEISETEEEEFIERYTLSQEVTDHYMRWAKESIDSLSLQVLPPWPDTKSCMLEFATLDRQQWQRSGDTLRFYHYTTTTENGVTQTDTIFSWRILATEQEPLLQNDVPEISKHTERRNARYYRRSRKEPGRHRSSRKTTKRIEIDRKRHYEKRIQKESPNTIIEIFYK